MKDISPPQREVLERAAQHVKIFERLPKDSSKKDLPYGPGCFMCSHSVGSLDVAKPYITIELTALDDDYYDSGGDPSLWSRFAFVASPKDVYWSKKQNIFTPMFSGGGMWPMVYKYYYNLGDFDGNGVSEVYARIVSYGGATSSHVNKKVDFMEYFNERGLHPNTEMVASVTPSTYAQGIYVDPSFPTAGTEVIDQEAIHIGVPGHMLYEILQDSYGGTSDAINLKRIQPKKDDNDKKLIKAGSGKKLTYTWTQTASMGEPPAWAQGLDDAINDYALDPFELGDS